MIPWVNEDWPVEIYDNYFHDIIVHIGDNYLHTKQSENLLD